MSRKSCTPCAALNGGQPPAILTSKYSRLRSVMPTLLGRGPFNVEILIFFGDHRQRSTTLKDASRCQRALKLILRRDVRFFGRGRCHPQCRCLVSQRESAARPGLRQTVCCLILLYSSRLMNSCGCLANTTPKEGATNMRHALRTLDLARRAPHLTRPAALRTPDLERRAPSQTRGGTW